MKKEIIINASLEETRVAILEGKDLVELYLEKPENERMVGDIYKGKVENVVQGIQAAFVDIGLNQNGFLPFADIGEEYSALAERVEDTQQKRKKSSKKQTKRTPPVQSGQEVLVQVTKEPISNKGTRLTTSLSLPGRFLVLVPNNNHVGISRKIKDGRERRRLRMLAKSIKPSNFGLIIRTVAVGRDVQSLNADLENQMKNWKRIQEKAKSMRKPGLVYKDMGITSSVVRDLFSPDIDHLVVDSRKLYGEIKKYLKDVSPALLPKLELYKKQTPVFDEYKIEEAIEKSLARKIWMKSGGYIIFDYTEAMVVIDVNSGRSVNVKDHELNALKTNLEAAREIAHQLRLRDIGGIIVIDFIDLSQDKNRKKVVSEIQKELKNDRAAFDILPMSEIGIVQMTRERVRPSLLFQFSEPCPRCHGLGRVVAKSSIITMLERKIQQIKLESGQRRMVLRAHPDIINYITHGFRNHLLRLKVKYFVSIKLIPDEDLADEAFRLSQIKKGEKV